MTNAAMYDILFKVVASVLALVVASTFVYWTRPVRKAKKLYTTWENGRERFVL